MKRSVWIGIALALAVIITLSFKHPHEMVSPGNLIPAHAALEKNCFACHAPFRGASTERCTTCHVVADLGLRTTKGVAIPKSDRRPAFHQALIQPDCMACHSDHPPPRLTKASAVKFDHALLKADTRANCQSCHTAPRNELHRGQALTCATCHQPAHWKAATFDHSRYFLLDRNHNTACTTCHRGSDYTQYTCFGCHEHLQAGIIAEHREKGITNFRNCVGCHRNAHGYGERETEN